MVPYDKVGVMSSTSFIMTWVTLLEYLCPGADPGFEVRGTQLKYIFWVFRVKNYDFTQKKSYFSNFRAGRAGCAPLLDPPLVSYIPWNMFYLS